MGTGNLGYPSDWHDQVEMGLVPQCKLLRKFGDNEAVPSGGVTTDVWNHTVAGVNRRVLPTSAGTVSVVSSSAEDDPDKGGAVPGTGMHTLVIEGLDANYLEISEAINLNGTAAVTTTKEFLRINRMYGVFSGTTAQNVGNITATIGANVQAVIEALEGQTHQALYTVPADMWLHVTDFEITIGRIASSADLHAFGEIMVYGHNTWRIIENVYMASGQNFDTHRPTVMFPPRTELRVSVHSDAVAQMSAMFGGILIETNYLKALGSSKA